jgi:hypothetical protein
MTEKKIRVFLDTFDRIFSLHNYDKKLVISDKQETNEANQNYEAVVVCDRVYQTITIKLYPLFFKGSDVEQKKTLIHELCHSLLGDYKNAVYDLLNFKVVTKDYADNINEETTSKIENIIDSFLTGKFNEFIKEYKK